MADIVTTRIFQDGEKNITAQKLNDIVASSTIQPAFVSAKPSTSTIATTDNLLVLQTAGTYAKAPFQTVIDSVSAGINADAEIWKVRLRSFNSIGNSTFEVDQRKAGLSTIFGTGTVGALVCDRWNLGKAGATMTLSARQYPGAAAAVPPILLPGTNFAISSQTLVISLTAQQATLAAGDYIVISQTVEGQLLRELIGDVHSVSILVSCTQPITFSIKLSSTAAPYYTITKLCTIATANQWTMFTLPALPVWPSGATWPLTPGSAGYTFGIGLGAGTTYTSPANDTWQAGNWVAGPGTTNFASLPVNAQFQVAFVQHEPTAVCSTPMDLSFDSNLDSALRYYQKTYQYAVLPGTVTNPGMRAFFTPSATTNTWGSESFKKPMAKVPTMTAYNHATGAAGSVQDVNGVNHASASIGQIGDSGFCYMGFTTATTTQMHIYFHYTADTGW